MLIIMTIGHLISDFFLQSSVMAYKKRLSKIFLLIHCLIYCLVFAAITFTFLQLKFAIIISLIFSITHFVIDFIKVKVDNKFKNEKYCFIAFLLDQILHLLVIFIVYYMFDLPSKTNAIYNYLTKLPDFNKGVAYTFLFLILHNPTAVFIRKFFSFITFSDKIKTNANKSMSNKNVFEKNTAESEINNAGSIIGKLERIIIAVLLLNDQYGVIGLVITAKSIARYKQLEDQNFAEKYLIGTLVSLLISLIVTVITKNLLI